LYAAAVGVAEDAEGTAVSLAMARFGVALDFSKKREAEI
jgi:hypothetical protein